MRDVFVYGTLCDHDLRRVVLGRTVPVTPARLQGFACVFVAGRDFPMIVPREAAAADGLILEQLSEKEVARLDYYEGPYGYQLQPVELSAGSELRQGLVYRPGAGALEPGGPWDLAAWQRAFAPVMRIAATEYMAYFGTESAAVVARRLPVILNRAQSATRARAAPSPVALRAGTTASQRIKITSHSRPYSHFFAIDDLTVSFPKFDGSQSAPVERAVFLMSDAVTLLPYDPVRDRVLLIEQFRVGVMQRGDPHPWVLETIAGRIDFGEQAEHAARREAIEEAGVSLHALHRIASYYVSPGAVTEYLTSYLGLADLPDEITGVGGLEVEDEDIRSQLVSFDRLMDALDDGEVETGPLVISALWLARHRERLRAGG